MASLKAYHRPYPAPEARSFAQWCTDLGIRCEGSCPDANSIITFDEFCFLPNVKLIKVKGTELDGFWLQYADIWGECRTVQEWLNDLNFEIVDPTEEDLRDLSLFLGYDEFMNWSSGKVTNRKERK